MRADVRVLLPDMPVCQAIGYGTFSLGQLKIIQEMITLAVFVPFAIFYMKEAPKLDYLWGGLCILAAAYFIFRSR